MPNNLKKVSGLDPIDPSQMIAGDLFYYVHEENDIIDSYSLSFADLFLGTNYLTSDMAFNGNTLYIKSGKVGINGSPDFTQTLQVSGSVFISSYANVNSYLITGGNITSKSNIISNNDITAGGDLVVGGSGSLSGRMIVAFDSGTKTVFIQSAAPTGWTKITTYNDYALRIVSGSVTTGGSVGFSSIFSSAFTVTGSVGSTTITESQMPSHGHSVYDPTHRHYANGWARPYDNYASGDTTIEMHGSGPQSAWTDYMATGISLYSTGGSSSHGHSLSINSPNLAVKYVDAIICSFN